MAFTGFPGRPFGFGAGGFPGPQIAGPPVTVAPPPSVSLNRATPAVPAVPGVSPAVPAVPANRVAPVAPAAPAVAGGPTAPIVGAMPADRLLPGIVNHPAVVHTNGMFGFPFRNMPVGGAPGDWQDWAGSVKQWAQGLGPQVDAWAQQQAPNVSNPFVWQRQNDNQG